MDTVKKIKPFQMWRADICPKCHKANAIQLMVQSSSGITRYRTYSDKDTLEDLQELFSKPIISVEYLMCKYCHEKFFPRWENGICLPLEGMNEHDYMALFRASKNK